MGWHSRSAALAACMSSGHLLGPGDALDTALHGPMGTKGFTSCCMQGMPLW